MKYRVHCTFSEGNCKSYNWDRSAANGEEEEEVMKEIMYKMTILSETKPEKPDNQRVETLFFSLLSVSVRNL